MNLVGIRFGRLTVLAAAGRTHSGNIRWDCACDCGSLVNVAGGKLRGKDVVSCGCWRRERITLDNFVHGYTSRRNIPAEYKSFDGAKQRCTNPKNQDYSNYGGRGIRFAFKSFEEFMAELGQRPPGKTLDRIDNDGNYEPGNVRWATPKEQIANQRPRKRAVHA